MQGLSTAHLREACRIFLSLAYPEGEQTIPAARRVYLHYSEDQPLESWLTAPVCQPLVGEDEVRGYAWRLGCRHFPHLKLRATNQDHGESWVFSVDTHDAVRLEPGHPDAPRWAQLQRSNQTLKEQIEQRWAEAGLLTFDALLRRDLDKV
jgi:hypothetical protein